MHWHELRAVARSLAYGLYDTDKSFPIIGEVQHPTTSEKNMIVEFWHCLNRKYYVEGPHVGERIVENKHIDTAIANTLAWLKWYQRGGHEQDVRLRDGHDEVRIPMPEWGKEYV